MRALALLLSIAALAGCSTVGPINRVSADARQEVGVLAATYASFAANSKAISDARIEADAGYRLGQAELAGYENETALIDKVAASPTVAFATDIEAVRASLKGAHLDPPRKEDFTRAAAEKLKEVTAPSASLAKVNATLKQLEREKSAIEAFLDYAQFFAETAALIDEKIKEAKATSDDAVKAATEKLNQ